MTSLLAGNAVESMSLSLKIAKLLLERAEPSVILHTSEYCGVQRLVHDEFPSLIFCSAPNNYNKSNGFNDRREGDEERKERRRREGGKNWGISTVHDMASA